MHILIDTETKPRVHGHGACPQEGALDLFDLGAAERMSSEAAHEGAVWSLSPLPDKSGFVSGSADKTVKFWQVSFSASLYLNYLLCLILFNSHGMRPHSFCASTSPSCPHHVEIRQSLGMGCMRVFWAFMQYASVFSMFEGLFLIGCRSFINKGLQGVCAVCLCVFKDFFID